MRTHPEKTATLLEHSLFQMYAYYKFRKSATFLELSLFQIYAYYKFFEVFQFHAKMIIQRNNKETLQFLKEIDIKLKVQLKVKVPKNSSPKLNCIHFTKDAFKENESKSNKIVLK